jgi:hypothetical protein
MNRDRQGAAFAVTNEVDGIYSYRNAAIGSIRTARRAGIQHDAAATATIVMHTLASVTGSRGEIR